MEAKRGRGRDGRVEKLEGRCGAVRLAVACLVAGSVPFRLPFTLLFLGDQLQLQPSFSVGTLFMAGQSECL